MLKGISPLLSPELLKALCAMGHGDEIILADAHLPGHSINSNTIRADGIKIALLLDGILPLFELDSYETPLVMMAPAEGDSLDEKVERDYRKAIEKHLSNAPAIERLERFEFYERAKKAYATIITGETAKYGNILLKKGVTPEND